MKTTYTVCDECNVGLANDDWTHLDFHYDPEESEEVYAGILASVEAMGWVTRVGEADKPGYFTCWVCNEIQCGGGHTWEGDK